MFRVQSIVGLVLLASNTMTFAGDKDVWVGRDTGNNKVFWTCTNVGGDTWKLKKNGQDEGTYEGVTSTSEFTELQLKGEREPIRVRMYADRMEFNKKGSKTEWITIAKGKWGN